MIETCLKFHMFSFESQKKLIQTFLIKNYPETLVYWQKN